MINLVIMINSSFIRDTYSAFFFTKSVITYEDEKEEMTNTMKKEVVKTDEISPIEFSRNYFQDLLGIKL